MSIEHLETLIAFVLAGSLAMERVVAIVKTLFPRTFGEPGPAPENIYKEEAFRERKVVAGLKSNESPPGERAEPVDPLGKSALRVYVKFEARRIYVLALVMGASLLTSYVISTPLPGHSVRGIQLGTDQSISFIMFGLLISGGSAFWSQCLGVVGAIKDLKAKQRPMLGPPAQVIVIDKGDTPRLDQ
jgi:hypothetical protein